MFELRRLGMSAAFCRAGCAQAGVGVSAPNSCAIAIVNGCPPPPALLVIPWAGLFESLSRGEVQERRFASRWSGAVLAGLQTGSVFRVVRSSPCASPHSAPLRPPHPASLPASQALGVVTLIVLGRVGEHSRSHARTAPHLASVIMLRSCLTSHHDSSPPL